MRGIHGLLLLVPAASLVMWSGPAFPAQPPVNMRSAAAVVIRDSTIVYADSALQKPLLPVRLGDAFALARLTDSVDAVVVGDGTPGFLRARDAGVVGLPSRETAPVEFGRRYHPYVLWFAARHFSASNPGSVWAVPADDRLARLLYARLATDFPADTIVARPLQVPDLHVRYGAVEGNLRLAEMDLADGDSTRALTYLRAIVDRYASLAKVNSLDALVRYMIGDILTRSRRGRAEGVSTLFDVVQNDPRAVVIGLAVHRVPSLMAARALTDPARFPAATVAVHARRLRAMMPGNAMRMITDVAMGRVALARKQYARADSFAAAAFGGERAWVDTQQGSGAPLRGNPRPAADLLLETWIARGARLADMGQARALAADTSFSADLRGLANKVLLRAADHGSGRLADIDELTPGDDVSLWRGRKDSGGFPARTRAAASLRAGDWDDAPVLGTIASGESLRVLYVDTGVRRTRDGAIVHRVKVETTRGVAAWLTEADLDESAWWRPLCDAPPGPARVIARAVGDRDDRATLADVTGDGCMDLVLSGAGWAVDEPAFEEDRPAYIRDAAALVDGRTGRTLWLRDSVAVNPSSPPPAGTGWIAVPVRNGVAFADPATGATYGAVIANRAALSGAPPLVWSDARTLVYARNDSLVALDPRTARRTWAVTLPGEQPITAGPACDGQTLVVATGLTGSQLTALDLSTGAVRWRSSAPDHPAQVWIGGGTALVSNGAEMWAVASDTGRLRWNHDAPASQDPYASTSTRDIAFDAQHAILANGVQITALDGVTGRDAWSTTVAAAIASSPVVVRTSEGAALVAFACVDGSVTFLDAATGATRARVPLRSWSPAEDAATPLRGERWNTAWLVAAENLVAVAGDDGVINVVAAPRR